MSDSSVNVQFAVAHILIYKISSNYYFYFPPKYFQLNVSVLKSEIALFWLSRMFYVDNYQSQNRKIAFLTETLKLHF